MSVGGCSPSNERSMENPTETASDLIVRLRRSARNRESADEISRLEAELRRAYAAKELEAQIAEREVQRYVESVQERRAAEVTLLSQQVALREDERRRHSDLQKSKDHRTHLEQQMARKLEEKRITSEEARREREILEEVERLTEELEASKLVEKKHELVETARRDCLILSEMKELRRQEQRESEARERRREEAYSKELERRARETRRLRMEQLERHERVVAAIADMIISAEARKWEREALIAELVAEDVASVLSIREKEAEERRRRMREELAASLEEQMLLTERCKLRFLERDRAFAEEIMRKIMEDEKTARLTAAARRRAQLQYREELSELIEERRRIREKEIARMEEAVREEARREAIRMGRIREERKRLLEEHAANVADFVNKAALTSEERAIIAKSQKGTDDTRVDGDSIAATDS